MYWTFLENFLDIVHLMNLNFTMNLDFLCIQCTQFFIEFSRYPRFNKFEIFLKWRLSVHLMYTTFHWIFTISYISRIRIFPQIWTFCTSSVHNFPLNFHDIVYSSNLNFPRIRTVCTFTVRKIPLNFHDIVQLTNSNFSTYFNLFFHLMYSILRWILMICYIQRIRFFSWIWTYYTSNVHNFLQIFTISYV